MRELGIDICGHRSKSVDEFTGQHFDYILTVCDNQSGPCWNERNTPRLSKVGKPGRVTSKTAPFNIAGSRCNNKTRLAGGLQWRRDRRRYSVCSQ
jgi:hypothetical protein